MLVIITTHPIQYQAPLWQRLAHDGRVPFEVWFLSHDKGFGKAFAWDIDLTSGYSHRFLRTAAGASPDSFWGCRLTERLRDRLREVGAKFVWIQGWQVAAYWQAVREAKAVGAQVWLRGESNDLARTAWWKRPLKRVILGELFRHVDAALYIGSANKRMYEKFGIDASRLHSAPYCVDNARFEAQAASLRGERERMREHWGIPKEAFCILFCGKFVDKKRPMDLVQAAASLRRRGQRPRIHLLFVGSGELEKDLRAACQVINPSDIDDRNDPRPPATFAGFLNQTEISRAYVAADCLVLPSDSRETWGLVVNEALASGLPCIVSDRCGCAEDLVAPANAKLRYPCGDLNALADAVSSVSAKYFLKDTNQLVHCFSFDETINAIWALARTDS
jgi:glycosyltransferase involved in cell wall biosynthesis